MKRLRNFLVAHLIVITFILYPSEGVMVLLVLLGYLIGTGKIKLHYLKVKVVLATLRIKENLIIVTKESKKKTSEEKVEAIEDIEEFIDVLLSDIMSAKNSTEVVELLEKLQKFYSPILKGLNK